MEAMQAAITELGIDDEGGADPAPIDAPSEEAPAPDLSPEATATPVPDPVGTDKTAKPTETPSQAAQRARDETGRFTKAPLAAKAASTGTKPPLAGTKGQTPVPKPQEGAQTPAPVAKAEKPPPSWSPPAREHWGKLPQEVREDVWRREQETSMALRESAEARQFHQTFAKLAAPYESMFRAEGVDALRGAGNLFQAFGVLQQGNPGAKAQLLATIGKTYGIDPQLLTDAWNGTASPETQAAQHSVDPRIIAQQVRAQVMADIQQERQQTHLTRAAGEVETFGQDKEFFHDVRGTMAAILDGATQSRQHMTLDQAYRIALQFHPGTSSVIQQREARDVARNAQASTERARAAASSVRSQPVSAPRNQRDYGDRMSAIEAAWEEAASR
jgi:hypothetical protein